MTSAARHPWRRKLPALLGGGFLLLFTAAVVYMVWNFISNAEKPQAPRVQRISLIKPPPPRPPEEKPPEPEKVEQPKEEMPIEQPQPTPEAADQPPPGPDLAVEGEGGAGNDFFGLLGKKRVTELGGRGGDREAWYGRLISHSIEDSLRRSRRLKGSEYLVTLNVWFDAGGAVQKVQLVRGSGSTETDTAIREELLALPPMREAFPDDLPQPVRLRLSSRA